MPTTRLLVLMPHEGIAVVPLTKGMFALIDLEDAGSVQGHSWAVALRKGTTSYAVTRIDNELVFLHNFLVTAPAGMLVDHKNRNGLDNRRANLRTATHSQNSANRRKVKGTSRFRGVSWFKPSNCWIATIKVRSERKTLGYFHDEEEAAHAYDLAAAFHFGEFASLNFPETELSKSN